MDLIVYFVEWVVIYGFTSLLTVVKLSTATQETSILHWFGNLPRTMTRESWFCLFNKLKPLVIHSDDAVSLVADWHRSQIATLQSMEAKCWTVKIKQFSWASLVRVSVLKAVLFTCFTALSNHWTHFKHAVAVDSFNKLQEPILQKHDANPYPGTVIEGVG